ncbi:MAG: nucleotidyltransferase domain-containing protein [Alphaproteobacteria bacterium]|nr:nucleotidyltransferase domain-containing protein [Alphaproteobacteria bacterium]
MPTPTMSFRVQPERQRAVREVVNSIKNDPELVASMLQIIHSRPMAGSGIDDAPSPNLGPFRSEEAALSFMVGRLRATLRPEAIFLFGSRATGGAQPDADFDLLVILPDSETGPPDYFAAYAPLAGCGLGVDVVPCRAADFAAERRQSGTIAYAADREGRLLYARPGGPFRERYRADSNR